MASSRLQEPGTRLSVVSSHLLVFVPRSKMNLSLSTTAVALLLIFWSMLMTLFSRVMILDFLLMWLLLSALSSPLNIWDLSFIFWASKFFAVSPLASCLRTAMSLISWLCITCLLPSLLPHPLPLVHPSYFGMVPVLLMSPYIVRFLQPSVPSVHPA